MKTSPIISRMKPTFSAAFMTAKRLLFI
jgi:hypothetical protein